MDQGAGLRHKPRMQWQGATFSPPIRPSERSSGKGHIGRASYINSPVIVRSGFAKKKAFEKEFARLNGKSEGGYACPGESTDPVALAQPEGARGHPPFFGRTFRASASRCARAHVDTSSPVP